VTPPKKKPARSSSWQFLVPFCSISIYLLISFALGVGTAGLQEDEAISFQHAAGLSMHGRIQCTAGYDKQFGETCLPLMIAPYVGAGKDYVLLPFFWIAGFSVGLARMGAALLAACGIFGAWFSINKFFGPAAGAITAGFLALHPSYLDLPLFDQGNIAFSLAILGFLLVVVAQAAERPSHGRFFLMGLLIGLGIWGRLNFAWLVLAAGLAALAVFRLELLRLFRYAPALIAGTFVGAAPLWLFLRRHSGDVTDFMAASAVAQTFRQNLRTILYSLQDVILASQEHRVTWHGGRIDVRLSAAMLILSAIAVVWCFLRRGRASRAAAITVILLLAEFLFSGLPVASHHTVIFVPLVALALGIAVSDLLFIPKVGLAAVGFLSLAYSVTVGTIDLDAVSGLHRTRGYGESSASISQLADFLKAHPDQDGLYMLDWGLGHPILLLSKCQLPSTNLFQTDTSAADVNWRSLVHNGGTFATYSLDNLHFPEATIAFEQELEQSGEPFKKTSFQERDGSPYADIYVVPRSAANEVTSSVPGTHKTVFLASPAEIVSQERGSGKTTLVFWTDQTKFVEIRVGAPDGPLLSQFRSVGRNNSGVAKTGVWVTDGMTFYLQDVAGKPLTAQNTLATVKVSVKAK
jgi:hypothetical protein